MDDMIKAIAEAENKAAEIKNQAVITAGEIIEKAREQAAELEAAGVLARTKMRDEKLNAANKKAQQDYENSIASCRKQSKDYAEKVAQNSDVLVGKIVGRVSGGNC
jgi:vacuolar-type H+-ATPase subunit H